MVTKWFWGDEIIFRGNEIILDSFYTFSIYFTCPFKGSVNTHCWSSKRLRWSMTSCAQGRYPLSHSLLLRLGSSIPSVSSRFPLPSLCLSPTDSVQWAHSPYPLSVGFSLGLVPGPAYTHHRAKPSLSSSCSHLRAPPSQAQLPVNHIQGST